MKLRTKRIITLLACLVVAYLIASCDSDKSKNVSEKIKNLSKSLGDSESSETSSGNPISKEVAIGTTTSVGDFEITIYSFKLQNQVNTGNMYSDLESEDGIKYAIVDIGFKNISKQSAMVTEGSVVIEPASGDPLVMDNTETVLADGWGLFLDQLNPMVAKRTKLVYKVPSSVSGKIYFDPEMGDETVFYLGEM